MTPQIDILCGKQWDVWQGDCLDLMKRLPDGCVDAVVTDPPYGIASVWKGGGSSGWRKTRSEAPTRNSWDDAPPSPLVFEQIFRVAKKIVIWGGNYFSLPPSRCWLLWVKPERNFSLAEAEMAWTNLDAVVRCFDAPRQIPGREHPTQKPVSLMTWSIEKLKLTPGSLVLDPFCGSGSTGVACAREGMRFIGMELSEEYADIARARIAAAAAQPRLEFYETQECKAKPEQLHLEHL